MRLENYRDTYTKVYDTLDKYLFPYANIANIIRKREIATNLWDKIADDMNALIKGDPAAQVFADEKSKEYVSTYKSLEAVMMYRISNYIYNFEDIDFDYSDELKCLYQTQARALSEKTKAETSVEIHPAAEIGKRFVIDHGCATVIGETCIIGDDCYILHGVTLGAGQIKGNPTGRRHPKLGNSVQVGGFARLYGKISIGDNTTIYGYTVIDRDIPANKEVSVINQFQLCKNKKDVLIENTHSEPIIIYGLRPYNNGLEIIGKNLNHCTSIELLKNDNDNVKHFSTTIENKSDMSLFFLIDDIEDIINDEKIKSYNISVNYNEENIILANSIGWSDYIKNKKASK